MLTEDICWLICIHYGLTEQQAHDVWALVRSEPLDSSVRGAVIRAMFELGLRQ